MKNILVVSGHPNPSASLANKTILESLRATFPQAQFRELASIVKDGHFDPVPEQEALEKADVIVLQFPFNWYSVPGLLKTWIDEVLLHAARRHRQGLQHDFCRTRRVVRLLRPCRPK